MEEKKLEDPYLFSGKSPRRVGAGSKVLFSFEAQVFGKATAKSDVEDISFEEQEKRRQLGKCVYKHSIVFEGSTVKLLQNTVAKKKITEKLGIEFGEVFRYLTKDEYNAILRMAK